jgi:hypothetical protein
MTRDDIAPVDALGHLIGVKSGAAMKTLERRPTQSRFVRMRICLL